MVWQDIYGEMQDDCGRTVQHTSSRRGIVRNISFHTKSHALDTVIDLSVLSADRDKKFMQTGEIKCKIQEWKNKESHGYCGVCYDVALKNAEEIVTGYKSQKNMG
jgi:hypothetical protein